MMISADCIWDAQAVLGEGPVWVAKQQALYWVDIKQSVLHRYGVLDQSKQSWGLPNMISSVAPLQNQDGLIATFADGVFYIDQTYQKCQRLADPEPDLPNNRLNDGCCDPQGNYWFGSMDDGERDKTGAFYCLDKQGRCHQVLQGIAITNGPTFTADGRVIYYTDTLNRTVYRAYLDAQCRLTRAEVFVVFQEGQGYPDGMCTDCEDHVWITHWGGFQVTRYTPNGKVDCVIELPVPNVSKCVFAGDDLTNLYITTARHGLTADELKKYPLSGGLFVADLQGIKGFEVSAYAGPVE